MENYTTSSLLGFIFSSGTFLAFGWADLLAALVIGFIGAVGGILANILYKYLKKKF